MRELLKGYRFPTDPSAYEIPDYELPESNPFAASVRAAGVKLHLGQTVPKPDFLTTRLDESIVSLERLKWNKNERRLSRTGVNDKNVTLATAMPITCLVAPSGAGKTRVLFETCYKRMSVYLIAAPRLHGSSDLQYFLNDLPSEVADGSVDELRNRVVTFMNIVMLARCLVLEAARQACPSLEPRHWLALQIFPRHFVKDSESGEPTDIFHVLSRYFGSWTLSLSELLEHWTKSTMTFVMLDEAQRADSKLRNTFVSQVSGERNRSVLSPILHALLGLSTSIVLAGTGLGIQSAYETADSSVAKDNEQSVDLLGITTMLKGEGNESDPHSVAYALRQRGITNVAFDEEVLIRFSGRPRFAMRLAEGLMDGVNPDRVANDIIGELSANLPKLRAALVQNTPKGARSPKSIYSELRRAAQRWVIRGNGTVWNYGEAALEAGVCALDVLKRAETSITFTIKEPLLIETFSDLLTAEFETISNESDMEIGFMLEDYIALNAQKLCDAITKANFEDTALQSAFAGPWKVAPPRADQRRGITANDGEEPDCIRQILDCAGGRGPSVVLPGVNMGADIVFAASREKTGTTSDEQRLLVFVQTKASFSASGPQAMNALVYPYHKNTGRADCSLRDEYSMAHGKFMSIINDRNTSVVFMVIKSPGNTHEKGFHPVSFGSTKVLQAFFDGKTISSFLPELEQGMEAMKRAKLMAKE